MKLRSAQQLHIECSVEELQQFMIEEFKKKGFLVGADDVKVINSNFIEKDTTEYGDHFPSSKVVGLEITIEYDVKEQ